MRSRIMVAAVGVTVLGGLLAGQSPRQRLNPMIDLLEQKKPIFGLYAPTAGGGRRGGAAAAGAAAGGGTAVAAVPAPAPAPVKTPLDLAKDVLAHPETDYIFSGSMEGGVDRGLPAFTEFAAAMREAGALVKTPFPHLFAPLVVKTPKIAPDPVKAIDNISRQLNVGVSTIMFVGVESADEVRQGLAAMRFTSNGGTRPDTVGTAPAYWGLTEAQYKQKADLWPLNPNGELVNWTIVESKEGLAHVREIAAVRGISVLFPGAGTLRGVFSGDAAGWEAAIQQVLAACKEFNVPCGYPATETDIETRMKQGFSVFVINWGDAGFRAVEIGRRVAGR
jgi:4-hydroxy-2-oxoheptanedioate aldolase